MRGGLSENAVALAIARHHLLNKDRSCNEYWMNPENPRGTPAFLRQPPLYFQANRCQANPSLRSHYMAEVFVVTRGDRTRYPHRAVATNRPAGRGEGPALEGRHDINI